MRLIKWKSGIAGNVVPTWESESGLVSINDRTGYWIHLTWIWMCSGSASWEFPSNVFFSFSLSFLFLFLSFKFTIFNHTHAPCVHSSVYLPINNYNNNHAPSALLQQQRQQQQRLATQLAATAQTIIKIILDAC